VQPGFSTRIALAGALLIALASADARHATGVVTCTDAVVVAAIAAPPAPAATATAAPAAQARTAHLPRRPEPDFFIWISSFPFHADWYSNAGKKCNPAFPRLAGIRNPSPG
jgi:hypothetical protein